MTSWQIALYYIVALWLMPGAIWRPVAMAVLATWAVGEAVYYFTGGQAPIVLYRVGDVVVVMAAIFYRSHWSDLAVLPIIAACWYWYTKPFGFEQWAWLYFLTVAQMIIVGPWPNLGRALSRYTHGSCKEVYSEGR